MLDCEDIKKMLEIQLNPLKKEVDILKVNQKTIIDLLLEKYFRDEGKEKLIQRSEELQKEFENNKNKKGL